MEGKISISLRLGSLMTTSGISSVDKALFLPGYLPRRLILTLVRGELLLLGCLSLLLVILRRELLMSPKLYIGH